MTAGSAPAARAPRPSGAALRFDAAAPLTVVLVRHGETPATISRTFSGSGTPGPGLAPAGRVQAAQAADLVFRVGRQRWPDLPHPSSLLASPMVRTQETARAVGRRLGLPVQTDERFAECHFGDWEGRTSSQIDETEPEALRRWSADPRLPAPGGEALVAVGDRVAAGLEDQLAAGTDRTVVIVSHAMAIRAGVGHALRLAPELWGSLRILPASLTVLRLWPDGGRELVTLSMPSDR
ncbi:histidine phosphatase family protein [Actinotalea sp.]|uniref:histidine phosphatase family protein n=1 Tax=Actinotalea sp. TaxID=1872145 RepID=UPI0035692FE1